MRSNPEMPQTAAARIIFEKSDGSSQLGHLDTPGRSSAFARESCGPALISVGKPTSCLTNDRGLQGPTSAGRSASRICMLNRTRDVRDTKGRSSGWRREAGAHLSLSQPLACLTADESSS